VAAIDRYLIELDLVRHLTCGQSQSRQRERQFLQAREKSQYGISEGISDHASPRLGTAAGAVNLWYMILPQYI
jgi:hypothetical protein